MKHIFIVVLVFLFCSNAFAQDATTDSLADKYNESVYLLNRQNDSLRAVADSLLAISAVYDSTMAVLNQQIAQQQNAQIVSGIIDTSHVPAMRDLIADLTTKYRTERGRYERLEAQTKSTLQGMNADDALKTDNQRLRLRISDLVAQVEASNTIIPADSNKVRLNQQANSNLVATATQLRKLRAEKDSLAKVANLFSLQLNKISSTDTTDMEPNPNPQAYIRYIIVNKYPADLKIRVVKMGRNLFDKKPIYVIKSLSLYPNLFLEKGETYVLERHLNYGSKRVQLPDYVVEVVPSIDTSTEIIVFSELQPGYLQNMSNRTIQKWSLSSGQKGGKIKIGEVVPCVAGQSGELLTLYFFPASGGMLQSVTVSIPPLNDVSNDTMFEINGVQMQTGFIRHIVENDFM